MYSPTMRISLHSNTTLGYVHSMERTWVLSSRMNLSESFSIKWFILSRLRLEGRYNILSNNYIQGYGKDNITQFLSLNYEGFLQGCLAGSVIERERPSELPVIIPDADQRPLYDTKLAQDLRPVLHPEHNIQVPQKAVSPARDIAGRIYSLVIT